MPLSPPPQLWNYKHMPPHPTFFEWVLGVEFEPACFCGWHSTNQSQSLICSFIFTVQETNFVTAWMLSHALSLPLHSGHREHPPPSKGGRTKERGPRTGHSREGGEGGEENVRIRMGWGLSETPLSAQGWFLGL